QPGIFLSPHGAHWDQHGDLYVMDWNFLGRVNKLRRVQG
ncbi:MAG: 6-bladed beta-propeller, partial [Planctomycetes bacterium]|nr:6-bladed beta-propeller [Planctomycetota bacterium]